MFPYLDATYDPIPVSETDLALFEADNSITLPDLLKDFYRQWNGVPMQSVNLSHNGKSFAVDRFFPLFAGSMSADHILEIYQSCSFVPAGFFPLALSEDGDDFFLDTIGGGVYLVPLDSPGQKKLFSNSLQEFFDLLESSFLSNH